MLSIEFVSFSNFTSAIWGGYFSTTSQKKVCCQAFIYFLSFNNILYKNNKQVIDNNTLVAITLLVAQSNPKEKEILIDLIMNFLC